MKFRRFLAIMMTVLMLISMMPTAMAEACNHFNTEWRWPNGKPANCQDWKESELYCKDCGEVTWSLEQCGDCKVGKWVLDPYADPPTCTQGSIEVGYCKYCGEAMDERNVDPLGHDWGSWAWDYEPTCQEGGYRHRMCKRCNMRDEEEVGVGDHKWSSWKQTGNATCQQKATETRTCTYCGKTETRKTNYGDHKYGSWTVVKPASCGVLGREERRCVYCNDLEWREISTGGHKFGEWKTESAATCVQKGKASRTCQKCGYKEYKDSDYGAHKWGGWKLVDKGDCKHPGKEERKCSVCGKTESRTTEEGSHNWGSWGTKKDATCTDEGKETRKCSLCGKEQSRSLDALGHKWGAWMVIQEAKPGQVGIRERKCSRCGKTERVEFYPDGTYKKGDKGDTVEDIQGALNDLGFNCGTVDGDFGGKTENAVEKWQESNGYPVDGILWPDQVDELLGNDDEEPAKKYSSGIDLELLTDCSQLSGELGQTIPVRAKITNVGETVLTVNSSEMVDGNGHYPASADYIHWDIDDGIHGGTSWFNPGEMTEGTLNIVVEQSDIDAGEIVRIYTQRARPLYCVVDGKMTDVPAGLENEPEGTKEYLAKEEETVEDTIEIRIPLNDEAFKYVTVEKSITSTPANGEYYVQGETISFLIKVVIPEGKTITDLEVTDPLKGSNEDATLDILPTATSADNTEYVFNYVVTAEDVERGYVENHAGAYFFDPEGDAWVEVWSETVGAPTGLSGSEKGTLTKKVINTPANGEYFTVGESIMYEIHFTNHCDYFVSDIAIKDPLLSGGKDEALDVIGVLWGGGIHRQYVVTEEDAAAGVVTNTATAEWTDPETGEAQFITSNTVVTPVGFGENGDGIVLTKSVVNMPENGIFHNGNTIQYEIQIANVSDETYYDVIVYDPILEFAELKTYDVMEPGFTDTIDFTYEVTIADAFAGYVENTAFVVRPGGADFQDRIYSNTVTVPCEVYYLYVSEIKTYGGIEITKSVISAPANGQYYVPGETVCYTMDVKNTGVLTLNDVAVRDQLYSATDPVAVFKTMAPGEMLSASFGYRVTEMDAINGSIKNIAQAVGYDPEGRAQVGLSNEVEVLTGMDGDFPFGVITEMSIVKEETSTPANGTYYTEGETISYSITYTNTGETPFGETLIYDTLKNDGVEIASAEMLNPGESRTCTFSYVVTAEDVVKGYVANSAIAKYDIGGGYTNTAISNVVVSDTDGDSNTTYVPGTGEIDWEKIRGTGKDENGNVLPNEDTCYMKAVSRDGDSIEYEIHFCTEHAQTQNSILTMANAAGDNASKQQMVWEYAYALWQKEIDAMYEEILPACDDAAKITVMSERVTHLAMVANTQFALKIAEPGQPAETAHAVAELWQDKCIDLCYLMNTAPSERVDSIFNVERAQSEAEIYEACSCVIIEEAEGKILCTDQYCPVHGFTYEMMELLLLTENSVENWATVRSLWEIELNTVYNALYKAASEEGGTAYLAEYAAYLAWLPAYEQFITMVYPENPEIVAEVMTNAIMERALDACARAK